METLLALPSVQTRAASDAPADRVRALGTAIDAVLEQWKRRDPNTLGEEDPRQPYYIAGALLWRRLHVLPKQTIAQLRASPEKVAGATITWRREEICRFWKSQRGEDMSEGSFKNLFERRVVAEMARALDPRVGMARGAQARAPHPLYIAVEPGEFKKGFWWRKSTKTYIAALARRGDLTIFAGADGDADVGEPLHRTIAQAFLADSLKDDPIARDFAAKGSKGRRDVRDAAAGALAKEIASHFADQSPSYIGSIVRGIYEQRGTAPGIVEGHLKSIVADIVTEQAAATSRRGRGFVDEAVAGLAAAVNARRDEAVIVTSHYDDDIDAALSRRRRDAARVLRLQPSVRSDSSTAAVVSEADLFAARAHAAAGTSWADELEELLKRQRAIFVGTDIRAPGLVAALVASRDRGHDRFAILLPPRYGPWRETKGDLSRSANSAAHLADAAAPSTRQARVAKALFHAALSARYLHLGVVPIIVDFPYQVPQLLREVQLRVKVGDDAYETYADRCDRWWAQAAPAFGWSDVGDESRNRHQFQQEWHADLVDLRELIHRRIRELGGAKSERVMAEVWIRRPPAREMFLWAASDSTIVRSQSAPRVSLRDPGGVIQEAFREGDTCWSEIAGGPWRYCVALPLVLEGGWHHLPIGVVRILSSEKNGALARLEDTAAAFQIEETVRALGASYAGSWDATAPRRGASRVSRAR